jgi:hypothetical protein
MLLLAGVIAAAAVTDPGRAMNHCSKPIKFAKASGTYKVNAILGTIGGSIGTPDVAVYDDSRTPFLGRLFAASAFGAKGKAWVATSVSGLGVSIEDWRSEETTYDFPALSFQSGSQDGSFSSGEACFESRGTTTWTFELVVQPDGASPRTVATTTRTVEV